MSENTVSNKQIAKNTIFLYIRMLVTMFISLFTSRLLLKTIGVDDFGIYGLVGGIVTMFASLKTMFTVATQRFLNIELGRNDKLELNKVFNVSLIVNIIIAVAFVVIVEIGGLWLLENKLNISADRMYAAHWVFQFSILASVITILNIPFDANIIAREKMNVFAVVSIIESLLRLGIVLLLFYLGGDKLIVYSFLIFLVSFIVLAINFTYCYSKFEESHIHRYTCIKIREKFKEMFAFSGWAFLGNVVFALVNEGLNILLNIFGSVVANAARNIAYQVRGALGNIVSNVYVAVKPQAIQSFARNDMGRFYNLMFTGAKIVGYMYLLLAIPIYFNLEEILMLWLGTIPEYSVAFISSVLLYQLVRVLHESIGIFFVTIGRLKEYQITEFIALGSALPFAYLGLKYFEMPLYGVFIVMTITECFNLVSILILAYKIGDFAVHRYLITVLVPYSLMTIVSFFSVLFLKIGLSPIIHNKPLGALLLFILGLLVQLELMYFVGLKKEERNLMLNLIKRNK